MPDIDPQLLGEHFNSIQVTMLEIQQFKEKSFTPTPTYQFFKPVNINEAWPECREHFIEMFTLLNDIAGNFNIEGGNFFENDPFVEAITAFNTQLNTIMFGLADVLGTGLLSPERLQQIDARILTVQHKANRLRKYVLEEFVYSTEPSRG